MPNIYQGYGEVQKKATVKYIKEKTTGVTVRFKNDIWESEILPCIENSGMSPTAFVRQAVLEKVGRDLSK